MSRLQAIRVEGGLFGPEILELLESGDLPGQRPQDFGLSSSRRLLDEIATVFADARKLWDVFKHRHERLGPNDPDTRVTRDAWMIPFLGLLGYDLRYNPRAYLLGDLTFAISHRAGENEDAPPVHIVGFRQELGKLSPSGRPRLSPHALLQEYLNRSDALWGLVTNGATLRLLRDSTFVRRQAYVEFDLRAILEEQLFADFAILFRLVHRSRLPQGHADTERCLLEQYYQSSIEQGGRVRDRLRDGVEECLKGLANGFLRHPANEDLRRRVALASDSDPFTPEELYHQLLRLVYRFLFLLVSEDRGLISSDPLYRDHYGVARLRRFLDQQSAFTEHDDLWCSLQVLWKVLSDEKHSVLLGAAPLDGELFAELGLDRYTIANRDLLEAFRHLAYYQEKPSSPPRRVNYAALDVEELGSVYESLLDYHPQIDTSGTVPRFVLASGSERKSTGSYYTPPELVAELIRSALEPVVEEVRKNARTREEKERAILSLKVCDPACGSGHFLLAAARRLGKELARIRTGEDEPAPEQMRAAVRDVVAHCIYGVDKNPLAVELARVALWLESHAEGKPLTFLEHRIRHGDSLVGVFDLSVLKDGIPDEAFEPLEGDDRKLAASLKRQNKAEREGQLTLFGWNFDLDLSSFAAIGQELDAIPDDSPELVKRKRQRYESRWADPALRRQKQACDLWTAAFFQSFSSSPALPPSSSPITTDAVRRALAGQPVPPQTLAYAEALSAEAAFFHWPLEFPEVFAQGGFDVVLGNPPWERIKLQEQEFFAARDAAIAAAPNAAARKRLIERLPQTNPALWEEYRHALHTAESVSRFLRGSGLYPLTGRGDINTYSVFAERMRALLAPHGRAGIIVPTGIATDATNQHFFADLVEKGALVSLFDFENREKIFPAVDSRYKFCLLTLSRSPALPLSGSQQLTFSFFATRAAHLRDPRRVFSLTAADIARINPNTRTLPVFRTRQDADLTRAIYARVPVLVNQQTGENPWGVRFLAMFHMSNDSHLFRTRAELEREGWRLEGNRFERGDALYLPLYEAKMIWHYDHRFGTYEGVTDRSGTHLPTPDDAQHADPHFLALPWYWVPAEEVQARLGEWKRGWLLGFRNVTNATNERTAIFSLLPRVGVGHSMPLLFPQSVKSPCILLLLANLTAIVFDYSVRQKLGGVNMTFGYIQQFPVLPPEAYTPQDLAFIVPRVLELTYTAWDLKPFADDVWRELGMGSREWGVGNGELGMQLRKEIIRQWEACHGIGLGEFLSRFGRLDRGDESGGDVLPPDRGLSQGGALRDDRSDPSGRCLGSGEHRRGLRPGESRGIHAILADLAGFSEGAGNPSASGSSGGPGSGGGGAASTGSVLSGGPHPEGFDPLLAEIIATPDSPLPIPPFRWDESRRAVLRAELDAYYARLYGLTRKQLRYILDPADLTPRELEDILDPWEEVTDPLDPAGYAARAAASDFPGETFRVLKEKEIREYGEYRTRRLVLEAWERYGQTTLR